jgi:hypothetical protein
MRLARPKHSTVVAYVALLFAMGGTAVAATGGNFILGHQNSAGTSTALKNNGFGPALKLANGHGGAAPFTINGNKHIVPGLNASYLGGHPASYYARGGTLPSGKSESGVFAAGSGSETVTSPDNGWVGYGVNFPRPLALPIRYSHMIEVDGVGPVTHCPAPGRADRGYLCLYDQVRNSIDGTSFWAMADPSLHFSRPYVGVLLYWSVSGDDGYVGGEWTVTAP